MEAGEGFLHARREGDFHEKERNENAVGLMLYCTFDRTWSFVSKWERCCRNERNGHDETTEQSGQRKTQGSHRQKASWTSHIEVSDSPRSGRPTPTWNNREHGFVNQSGDRCS